MHFAEFIDGWEALEAFHVEDLQTVQERGRDDYRERSRYSEEVRLLRLRTDFVSLVDKHVEHIWQHVILNNMLSKINKKNKLIQIHVSLSNLNNFWWKATRPQPRHLTGMPTKLSIQRFSGNGGMKRKTKKLKIHSSLRVTALDSDIPSES